MNLPIETDSLTWVRVRAYCDDRIARLVDECISPTTSADRRQECAARIDELKTLLGAPAAGRLAAQHRIDTPLRSY